MAHQAPQILSSEEKVVLSDQLLTFLKTNYPEPMVFDVLYQAGVSTNAIIAFHQVPIIYMFFTRELVDFVRARLFQHPHMQKYYLLIAAAALAKYIGTSYEGEQRKQAQIYSIKRGFRALSAGKSYYDVTTTDRRMFVIASELAKESQTRILYTSVPLGLEIASDLCYNVENKTNDKCRDGRDCWTMPDSRYYSSFSNNRRTNAPSLEFFEFLAADGLASDALFLSNASGFATMMDLLVNILNGRFEEIDLTSQ